MSGLRLVEKLPRNIIKVNRKSVPVYPDWVYELVDQENHCGGPDMFDLSKIEHVFNFQDGDAIVEKGPDVFCDFFGIESHIPLYNARVKDRFGNVYVQRLFLDQDANEVTKEWFQIPRDWDGDLPDEIAIVHYNKK